MSNYKQMMENVQQLHEIKGMTTGLVSKAREAYREELYKISQDRDLSDHGKAKKREELQKEYGNAFIVGARKLREEYDKTAVKARVAAEMLMNEGPQKPSETAVKSFEREFNALKTDLMLENRPDEAMRKLKAFAEAQDDAYLANQVLSEFSSVAQSVLDAAGSDKAKYKVELREALDTVRNKSTSDEQRQAQQIYEQMGAQFGANLFLENGIEHNAIKESFGPKFAQYANRPQYFVLPEEEEQQAAGE